MAVLAFFPLLDTDMEDPILALVVPYTPPELSRNASCVGWAELLVTVWVCDVCVTPSQNPVDKDQLEGVQAQDWYTPNPRLCYLSRRSIWWPGNRS